MKVTQLDVKGFRSLYDVSWKLGNLNVVIGPNGSGKTNLLTALELLSYSSRGRLSERILREGDMKRLLWNGVAPEISFRLSTSSILPDGDADRESLIYRLNLVPLEIFKTYRIEHELLSSCCGIETCEENSFLKLLERTSLSAMVYDERKQALVAPEKPVPENKTLLSFANDPFSANRLLWAYRKQLASWQIYSPYFRLAGKFVTPRQDITPTVPWVAPDGHNFVSVLYALYTDHPDFKQNLDAALIAAFGDNFEELIFLPVDDRHIQLGVQWRGLRKELAIEGLSEGMLQFLFVITVLAHPDPPPLIAIDEPVSFLNLSTIPIVAEYAVEAATRTQVVLTTHSPEFLDAFSDSPPTTTVLRWEDGKTLLHVVSDETLRYWLDEYTLGELYRSGELEDME
ncbi:MAG: AAA family ATPase [Anaerolineae bacterium]|nr:AAA family ATPase [Anaerolineae bacterium]